MDKKEIGNGSIENSKNSEHFSFWYTDNVFKNIFYSIPNYTIYEYY